MSVPRSDPLAVIETWPRELLPLAMMRIMARSLEQGTASPVVASQPGAMLSPAEAAMRLGVSRRWVWDHADRLGAVKLSRTMMRIPAENVERELQARGTRKAG